MIWRAVLRNLQIRDVS